MNSCNHDSSSKLASNNNQLSLTTEAKRDVSQPSNLQTLTDMFSQPTPEVRVAPIHTHKIERLHSILKQKNGSMTMIFGESGTGKTQLARQYAHTYASEYAFVEIIDSSSETSIIQDYAKLATKLGINLTNIDLPETIIPNIFEALAEYTTPWLLIFDDATVSEVLDSETILNYLPNTTIGHILVTTQTSLLTNLNWDSVIELSRLSNCEAVQFLETVLQLHEFQINTVHDQSLPEIASLCLNKPLLLNIAALSMVGHHLQPNTFLSHLKTSGFIALDTDSKVLDRCLQAFTADRREFLEYLSCFAPTGIPISLISKIKYTCGRDNQLQEYSLSTTELQSDLINPLLSNSFLNYNPEDKTYNVHSMIRQVVLNSMDSKHREQMLDKATQLILDELPDIYYTPFAGSNPLIKHAEAILKHYKDFDICNLQHARLNHRLGYYKLEGYNHNEAELMIQVACQGLRIFGRDYPSEYALACGSLGRVYHHNDNLDFAEMLYQKAFEAVIPNTREHATILHNYAELLRAIIVQKNCSSRRQEVINHLEEALRIRKSLEGDHEVEISETILVIGLHYRDIHNFERALQCFNEALAIQRSVFGESAPILARTYKDIGLTLIYLQCLPQAEVTLEKARSICLDRLGMKHKIYGFILSVTAFLRKHQGRKKETLSYLHATIELFEQRLGDRLILTNILGHLREVYDELGMQLEVEAVDKRLSELNREREAA